jgi:hypothetical protein
MSPPDYPSAWLRPRSAASVSPGKIIVAPPCTAVATVAVPREPSLAKGAREIGENVYNERRPEALRAAAKSGKDQSHGECEGHLRKSRAVSPVSVRLKMLQAEKTVVTQMGALLLSAKERSASSKSVPRNIISSAKGAITTNPATDAAPWV